MGVLSFTNVLTTLAVAYMSYSFYTLYKIAVPELPRIPPTEVTSIHTHRLLSPLWDEGKPIALTLSLSASQSASSQGSGLTVLTVRSPEDLTFGWDSCKMGASLLLSLTDPLERKKSGLNLSCRYGTAYATEDESRWCATLAGRDYIQLSGSGSLPLGTWSGDTPAASRVVKALATGQPVFAHIALSLEDGSGQEGRTIQTGAALVQASKYTPPKMLRYLWEDPSGEKTSAAYALRESNASLPVDAAARVLGGKFKKEVEAGTYRSLKTGEVTMVQPSAGQPWPHWVGQLNVNLIVETGIFDKETLPMQLAAGLLPLDAAQRHYLPFMVANSVRPVQDRYHPMNFTAAEYPIHLAVAPVSIGTWQLLRTLDASINVQHSMGATENDTDDVIRMLAETPMWLLGITMIVSCVHLLFDVLALKNDVSFWAGTNTLRGISIRSLMIQVVSNTIVTLYLYNEKSSLLVLIPEAAFTLLTVWKIVKASGVRFDFKFGLIPVPRFDAALAATATEAHTSHHDRVAVSYLGLILLPLLVGFVIHAFIYHQYAGWTDFALSAAVGAVYAFGFVLMTPQLWINYKLKSVAHMPWKVLLYRFFNTIIDDLFASIIKMPLMHRISVFRDDIIFVIYMYQRWLYPVDRNRPAEGYDIEESTAADQQHLAKQARPETADRGKAE